MNSEVDLQQLAIDRGSAAAPPRPRRRHLWTRYVLPAMLLIGFLVLVAWAARGLIFPPRPVTVMPVFATQARSQRAGTPLFNAAGWIEPRPTPVRVAALAPGVIDKLLVVEDQLVKAGEPVAELIVDDARLAHQRAEADLALRQAELKQAQAALEAANTRFKQPVHLEAPLGEAQAALAKIETAVKNLPFETRRAEAQLEFARNDYEGKLAAQRAIAGRLVDSAKATLESATALVGELRGRAASLEKERSALIQRRDALKTQLELRADEIKARDEAQAVVKATSARVDQARIALSEAELRLDRMIIRAPIDGRVYQLIGQPGSTLAGSMAMSQHADSSTVVTLYRPNQLQARVDVRFNDIAQVRIGQPVQIENAALDEPLTGTVLFTSSEADIQKNTLQVKVAIDDPPAVFKPEMLVDVTFLAPQESEQNRAPSEEMRIYVPESLVHQDGSDKFVWLADQTANVARRTPVETGPLGRDGLIEITRGLNISGRIIADGHEGLDDGDRIRITGEQNVVSGAQR